MKMNSLKGPFTYLGNLYRKSQVGVERARKPWMGLLNALAL